MKILRLWLMTFIFMFGSLVFAAGGYGAGCIDPSTGLLNIDKLMEPRYEGPAFQPYVADSDTISSIQADGDNKMVITMKDGSKHIFQRDP
ncbi:hypothetical protein, partial [Turicimonas muris]